MTLYRGTVLVIEDPKPTFGWVDYWLVPVFTINWFVVGVFLSCVF